MPDHIRKGIRRGVASTKKTPITCPCCQQPLIPYARRVVTRGGFRARREPDAPAFAVHERQFWVCEPCGVRVVLHKHPPPRTWQDERTDLPVD